MARGTSRRVRAKTACPKEVLDAPLAVRLKFFKKAIIHHPLFDDMLECINDTIESGLPGSMLVLVGPAGVGKSSVGDTLHRQISEDFFALNPDDKYTIPSALVEAWAPEDGRFDWKDFYQQILEALQAPLIENSLPEVKRVIAGREFWLPDITERRGPTVTTLRARLRRALRDRDPFLLFIDEASNVIQSPNIGRVKIKSNTLRSMVDNSNTTMIVSGAYDLYDLVLQSGQLARRGDVLHFPAYLPGQEGFAEALFSLEEIMPVKGGCNLDRYGDDFERESLRNTGLLKRIMMRVLTLSENLKRPIDDEIVKKSFYKSAQWRRLRDEMFDGYLKVEGHQHPEDERELMPEGSDDVGTPVIQKNNSTKKKHRVGKTKPSRPAIGAGRG
jgi:hypothetical protein